jgi:hypothetical protein
MVASNSNNNPRVDQTKSTKNTDERNSKLFLSIKTYLSDILSAIKHSTEKLSNTERVISNLSKRIDSIYTKI